MSIVCNTIHNINRANPFFSLLTPLRPYLPNLPKPLLTLKMGTQSGSSKRPICPECTKPPRTCLCTRFKTPKIENSIAITILQHSLEKNHPLNSTRIVSLGLKNVNVVSVFDVNSQAEFSIQLLDPAKRSDFCDFQDSLLTSGDVKDSNFMGLEHFPNQQIEGNCMDNDGLELTLNDNLSEEDSFVREDEAIEGSKAVISFVIKKFDFETKKNFGVITSFHNPWKELNFEKLIANEEAMNELSKGFIVKKLQIKECEKCEEFELTIPKGSVLLFPSENAISVDDIKATNLEVKNLIVLDGTWAKAIRMYNENPWLKVLPHLKLDIDKLSLYGEVRQQPKAGYLSTIESIVYALKPLNDHAEELDSLLDVFDSMVGDQRRCKDERLSSISLNIPSV